MRCLGRFDTAGYVRFWCLVRDGLVVSCYACLGCGEKLVKFNFSGKLEFWIQRDCRTTSHPIISMLRANRLSRNGCQGYLTFVQDTQAKWPKLEQMLVVKEFVDVFSEELTGLSPDREIEFGIELAPGIEPISIPSYRVAPTELKELKETLARIDW